MTHREMELLAESGFTPLEVIQAATMNGAAFLGVDVDEERIRRLVCGAGLTVARLRPAPERDERPVDVQEQQRTLDRTSHR